ncbi:hypothetical protein CYLTODRAFT_448166 [Cylindrobasidium torrendii FP15055 ss-10]|uniref:Vacuolar sorting protein Vps3844 C-terminal domain-containing protein n=1 Tax=Cylindrobasidium torrendii FP15055 ss-10 TaxID=1314674 RepID=A0A0D7BVF7_9AGAR|nr:hypothetical protein CYLTODRAFT_448166 [Cylindrobasidium torrendii FP15055 ss-10]
MLALLSLGLLALQPVLGINIYLNPAPIVPRSSLSPADASAVLSRHLGLESFEPFRDGSAAIHDGADFVGLGSQKSYLLTLEESDAEVIVPHYLQPSFTLPSPPVDSLYSVVSTYLNRAKHAYTSIFEGVPSHGHYSSSSRLSAFLDESHESEFSAIDLSGLATLRQKYGANSKQFQDAVATIREFVHNIAEKDCSLAILSYAPPATLSHSKRQAASQQPLPPDHAPPQQPIGSVSTCFDSEDACSDATDSCSGRGQCLQASKAGKTCFVCACAASKSGSGDKTKTEYWVGDACERKDVSSSFVLIVGTVLVLLLVVVGSISLLTSAGSQELPSTLLGSAVHAKKD